MKQAHQFVIDASVCLDWLYRDGDRSYMTSLLSLIKDDTVLFVPSLWFYEIMNGAVTAIRHKKFDKKTIEDFFEEMAALPIRICAPPDWNMALSNGLHEVYLALDNGLAAYDNAYLMLAMQMNLPLATLDKDLRKAARTAGIKDAVR